MNNTTRPPQPQTTNDQAYSIVASFCGYLEKKSPNLHWIPKKLRKLSLKYLTHLMVLYY